MKDEIKAIWEFIGSKTFAGYVLLISGVLSEACGKEDRAAIWLVGSLILFHTRGKE